MDNQVVRREVQRCDDPFGIPACFYWSVDEVADWVESIGYGKYKENFRSNFINGRKLLTVDACTLPQLGIVHFGDILDVAGRIRNLLCSLRRQPYIPPTMKIAFSQDHHYPYSPIDDLHTDYKYHLWYPRRVQPKQIWLSHPEFVASASTEELASCIKDVLGKTGKGVSWLPPIKGPRFNPHPQRLNVNPSEGRDLDYNWRLWRAEYYKGYTPKESPVTPADFYARWYHEMNTHRLLKAKKLS